MLTVAAAPVSTLFPAQAGVILDERPFFTSARSFPRASGGDPAVQMGLLTIVDFSPRKRG